MKSSDPNYVAAALDPLFALPLDFQPDIEEALALVEPEAARTYLVDRLRKDYQRGDCATFQEIFSRLDTEPVEEELIGLFRDGEAHVGARACALELICETDHGKREALLNSLDETDRHAVVDEPLRELIADAIEDSSAALALAYIAEHFPESRQLPLEEHIELLRNRMGATAATVYEPLLCSMKLRKLHESMIRVMVEEAAPDARYALACAAEATSDDEARKDFLSALESLENRKSTATVDAVGRLGPIDGPGRFEVAILVNNPEGTKTLAFLLIDRDEILDGFVDFAPPEDLLGSDHLPAVEISAAEIASVVAPALEKVAVGELDPFTRAALRYFSRLPEAEELSAPKPTAELDEELIDRLMGRAEYMLWAFAPEDFHQCEIPEPPENPDQQWVSDAMKCLNLPEVRKQVRRDAEYMSRWHLAAGEKTEAEALARVAEEIETSFETHPLIRAMVERSVEILHHPDLPEREVDLDDGIDLEQIHDPDVIREALLLEIIDKQIRGEDPKAAPEVYESLRENGDSDERARKKMARVLDEDLHEVIENERPHDPDAYSEALRRLV
ncbi:MAG: hypothetical protein R3338_07065 [Thermoanaerobaculia bacterium]|nr:hypothetical protein [Thermoanaerobaculia bacterium]